MKGCIDEKTFNRFVEDSLGAGEKEELKAHIQSCSACEREYQSWLAVKDQLGDTASIQVPEGFKERVMARVARERMLPAPFSFRRGLALLMTTAVLVYFLLDPFIGDALHAYAIGLLKEFSAFLYQGMGWLGLDPSAAIKLFGSLMSEIKTLFWVFASGTLFLVGALLAMIVKGRLRARSN